MQAALPACAERAVLRRTHPLSNKQTSSSLLPQLSPPQSEPATLDRRRKRPARKAPGQRQLEKSLKQLDGVLSALAQPDSFTAAASVVFTCGCSASRPVEAYEIRMNAVDAQHGDNGSAAADVARRVTRALVASLFDAPFAARSGCRVNVLLLVRRAAADGHATPPASSHWVLKRTLRPAWHRAAVLRSVHLRSRAEVDQPPPGGDGASIKAAHAAATAAHIHASCIRPMPPSRHRVGTPAAVAVAADSDEHMWYQCRAVFKAPPMPATAS